MTPVGTSNELEVQNEWEENTHTHTVSEAGQLNYSEIKMFFACSRTLCAQRGMVRWHYYCTV